MAYWTWFFFPLFFSRFPFPLIPPKVIKSGCFFLKKKVNWYTRLVSLLSSSSSNPFLANY